MEMALKTKSTSFVFNFINKTNERIKNKFFLNNADLQFFKKKESIILLFSYDSNMGNFPLYVGMILAIALIIFKGFTVFLVFPALIASLSYFVSPLFIFKLMSKGLKKEGHTEEITRLNKSEIIRELVL